MTNREASFNYACDSIQRLYKCHLTWEHKYQEEFEAHKKTRKELYKSVDKKGMSL